MPQLSFAKANKNNDVCDYNPLHPDIKMDIPLNVPYTFPKGLTRRGFLKNQGLLRLLIISVILKTLINVIQG